MDEGDQEEKTGTLASRGSEARTRGILAALPDLMFVVSRDLVFEDFQTPDPDALLVPPSAFIGKRVDEVLPPDVSVRVNEAVLGTLDDGERRTVPYALDLPGGRQWFEAISGLCDQDSVLFVVRDRTRQVLIEERLRVNDRMASLGSLASGIAHEINNPLTYVLANLDFIRTAVESSADQEIRRAFSDVLYGLEQVTALVGDLRVFSHPGPVELVSVDLNQVIESTLRIAKGVVNRKAALHFEPSELPAILGNASQVGQVVLNLVTNAIDALEGDSSMDKEIWVEAHADADRVVLRVSDSGVGIPPELGQRVFDPFVTSKVAGSGTGLGLAISRSIVEALGGTIRAESREPRGTVVTVSFVRDDSSISRPDEKEPEPSGVEHTEARILVVDDDERVAEITARVLAAYEVVVALDGRPALEILRGDRGFDLVLCDLMMPDMTGMELYRTVLDEAPELADRFLFMTGAAFSADARSFVESTSRPFLQKPFDISMLRRLVAEQLRAAQG